MKAIKATYKNGKIQFAEKPPQAGPVEVVVFFPESEDDPWEKILNEPTPRQSFVEFANKCLADITKGKATPLELDDL